MNGLNTKSINIIFDTTNIFYYTMVSNTFNKEHKLSRVLSLWKDNKMHTPLKSRWFSLFEDDDNINYDMVNIVYNNIVTAYTEPRRAYHNLTHLDYMFDKLDTMINLYMLSSDSDKKALYLATWFHDIIYMTNTQNKESNEAASANYALECLKSLGITDIELLRTVYHLIRATRHHEIDDTLPIDTLLQQILLDADLSILGADEQTYKQYVKRIELEWSHISISQFHMGRINFLSGILKKDDIFFTEYMKELCGAQAINNMTKELSILDRLAVDDLIAEL